MPKATRKTMPIELQLSVLMQQAKEAEALPKRAAYVFSNGGKLLAYQPINKEEKLSIKANVTEVPQRLRVYLGPDMEDDKISIAEVKRRGGEEKIINVGPGFKDIALDFQIPRSVWNCWLKGLCLVQGHVYKKTALSVDNPVPEALVQIYEVDNFPYIIRNLPLDILRELREIVVHPPIPDPGPLQRFELDQVQFRLSAEEVGFNPQPDPPVLPALEIQNFAAPNVSHLAGIQFIAQNSSDFHFREALVNYADIIRPLLCLHFPFLFYSKKLVATTKTNGCGFFRAWFSMGCDTDIPDLYFIVKQQIFANAPLTTIYEPKPFYCHTHWNYACGTYVTLRTTHPLAWSSPPCTVVDGPDSWVLLMAVGNYPMQLIQQDSTQPDHGLSTVASGAVKVGVPFGGVLRFRLLFDPDLQSGVMAAKYYRMSYRKYGTSDPFLPMTSEVHRHYLVKVGGELQLKVYPLGPQSENGTNNLFEIPPAVAPEGGVWAENPPDLYEDTTSAKFMTAALPELSGKYDVKLEVFDDEGHAITDGLNYCLPNTDNFSGTITTIPVPDNLKQTDGSVVITIYIDNNRCTANIHAPVLNGSVVANACGIVNYNPSRPGALTMPYVASHPHNFATRTFTVKRGAKYLNSSDATESVLHLPDSGGVSAVNYAVTENVSALLGACPMAGFAEILHVQAKATDGINRLSGYDASDVRAYVLAPNTD